MKRILAAAGFLAAGVLSAHAEPVKILAAENFYGEAATAIGGDRVAVTSVLLSPDVDPHDFEAAPSTARDVAEARIVIMNGADYDHWIEDLLAASAAPDRKVINVAELIGRKEGENPHVWYDPGAMPALAKALVAALSEVDPAGAADYAKRGEDFAATLAPLDAKIAAIKDRFAGTPVTATEPVFEDMAKALGLKMLHEDFQRAIMNETEPSAKDIAAVEQDVKDRRVKVLFYNAQVVDPLTEQLLAAAKQANVPVVSVTETEPPGKSFAEWMLGQLEATEKALTSPAS